jgi:hypothetical protein
MMSSFAPIPLEVFQERTGIAKKDLAPLRGRARKVVSLRDVVTAESVQAMPIEYLQRLISNVTLAGDPGVKPFAGLEIQMLRMDPDSLLVAQTFVERGKYRRILENISDFFDGFCVSRGMAKRTASIVRGRDADEEPVIAHYLPPIVEEHGGKLHLLDGTHRCFLIKAVGTTIETITVRGVTTPFPCVPQQWSDVRKVDAKPPPEERFVGLDAARFRDVKRVGIDG